MWKQTQKQLIAGYKHGSRILKIGTTLLLNMSEPTKSGNGRSDKIIKRYRDDQRSRNNPNAKFNILWSNVQTITPRRVSSFATP